jgi:hypothetical protein
MKNRILSFFQLLFLVVACQLGACQTSNVIHQKTQSDQSLSDDSLVYIYNQSILDARIPDSTEIYRDLVSIGPQNESLYRDTIDGENYVLVVAWKSDTSYYNSYIGSFYNTDKFDLWVTVAPELLERMGEDNAEDARLRLKQLLGLPPTSKNDWFIEFWVRPQDLFRPCPDSEIKDKECDLCFPDKVDSGHKSWINEYRVSSYYDCKSNFPWTQLGYTYDWSPQNESHIGLSEFVIDKYARVKIKAIYATDVYLNQEVH